MQVPQFDQQGSQHHSTQTSILPSHILPSPSPCRRSRNPSPLLQIETLKKQRRQAVMELLNKRHGRMDKGDPQGGQNSSKEGPSGDGSSGGAAAAPG